MLIHAIYCLLMNILEQCSEPALTSEAWPPLTSNDPFTNIQLNYSFFEPMLHVFNRIVRLKSFKQ